MPTFQVRSESSYLSDGEILERSRTIATLRQELELEAATNASATSATTGTETNYNQLVTAKLREEFECPVCLEQMRPPKQIYSCSGSHLFCQRCCQVLSKSEKLWCCPKCRENFALTAPIWNGLVERWAKKFFA